MATADVAYNEVKEIDAKISYNNKRLAEVDAQLSQLNTEFEKLTSDNTSLGEIKASLLTGFIPDVPTITSVSDNGSTMALLSFNPSLLYTNYLVYVNRSNDFSDPDSALFIEDAGSGNEPILLEVRSSGDYFFMVAPESDNTKQSNIYGSVTIA